MTRLAGAIGLAALAGALFAEAAAAQPARIILLRHGEKQNGAELCVVGTLRAEGLAAQYLGKDAPGNETLYGKGGKPDAFFAVTPHTQETAKPSADSWGLQLTVFSVPPKDPNEETDLGAETQKAAAALESKAYDGKTVVIVWEHKHIAKKALNKEDVTWRELLKLDAIPDADVPKSWEGNNYDDFWIVDYAGSQPTFTTIEQDYIGAAYAQVPNNAWGVEVDKSKFPEFYQDCEH